MAARKAIIVGISGCSSSGKTTLARLLRDIFPHAFVLHEDDFYKPESELPKKGEFLDWDCAGSLDLARMAQSLAHIRAAGVIPPDHSSKEDQNAVGHCPVSGDKVAALKEKVRSWTQPGSPGHALFAEKGLGVCLLDGFLLYSPPTEAVSRLLDLRLFLLVSRSSAIQRRKARAGYVTLEGFWEDPDGYVENVVWPNYVDAHTWLFENGDVEGKVDEAARSAAGIEVQAGNGLDVGMEATLEWAVDILMRDLPKSA